jgi:hypothetical protein
MGWTSHALLASALCLACGVQHPAYFSDSGEASSLYPGDEEDDDGHRDADDAGDCDWAAPRWHGPESTIFVALPEVRIHALDYPGVFAGQTAWFFDDVESGRPRYAFYLVPAGAEARELSSSAGAVTAIRNFQRICGSQRCRRGQMQDVRAAWAAQRAQWESDDTVSLSGALVEAR